MFESIDLKEFKEADYKSLICIMSESLLDLGDEISILKDDLSDLQKKFDILLDATVQVKNGLGI